MTNIEPRHLLNAARNLSHKKHAILDGRWQVTGAALARQSIEAAIETWLQPHGVNANGVSFRAQFVCVKSLHSDPPLVAELYNTWSTLSEACHANSYERPPTNAELARAYATIERFLATVDQ